MAAGYGREFTIKNGTNVICAGIMTKGVQINSEGIEITSDDDNGFRTFMAGYGIKSLDVNFEGVTKEETLRTAIISNTNVLMTNITIEFPDGGIISGDFAFTSLAEDGTHNDAVKFKATLLSSGTFTYV